MIIKNIVQIGNPLLKQKSKSIQQIKAKETQKVVKNLIDTMRYHQIIGMAASQIGEKVRIFVTEVRKTPFRNSQEIDRLRVFINPQITWSSSKEVIIYEGCASVIYGKLFAPVKRPQKIEISASDVKGQKFYLKADGLLSRVIQHEYDHLNGIEFTEKITDIRKIMSAEEYQKRILRKSR